MVQKRLVLSVMLLACFGSACTAIVLGKLGDTKDYKTVNTPGLGGSTLDECSLLKGDYNDVDANACSTCIESNCATDVAYACQEGQVGSGKRWFDDLKSCAQNPLQPVVGTSASRWGCSKFAQPVEQVSDDGSDIERNAKAVNCVNRSCMQTDPPPCKQCAITIKKFDDDQVLATLETDACGSCLVESCQALLVKCCSTAPIYDFVTHCAFTKTAANKAACLELGQAKPDAGAQRARDYDDAGLTCLADLSACFKANCVDRPACQ